jgi:hypothetical protein
MEDGIRIGLGIVADYIRRYSERFSAVSARDR